MISQNSCFTLFIYWFTINNQRITSHCEAEWPPDEILDRIVMVIRGQSTGGSLGLIVETGGAIHVSVGVPAVPRPGFIKESVGTMKAALFG
jgi:hypothetical protein